MPKWANSPNERVLGGIAWRLHGPFIVKRGVHLSFFAMGLVSRGRLCWCAGTLVAMHALFSNTLTNFKLGNAEYSDRWEHQVVAFPETNGR